MDPSLPGSMLGLRRCDLMLLDLRDLKLPLLADVGDMGLPWLSASFDEVI